MAGTTASPGWILCHSALPGVVLARTMGTTLLVAAGCCNVVLIPVTFAVGLLVCCSNKQTAENFCASVRSTVRT